MMYYRNVGYCLSSGPHVNWTILAAHNNIPVSKGMSLNIKQIDLVNTSFVSYHMYNFSIYMW